MGNDNQLEDKPKRPEPIIRGLVEGVWIEKYDFEALSKNNPINYTQAKILTFAKKGE